MLHSVTYLDISPFQDGQQYVHQWMSPFRYFFLYRSNKQKISPVYKKGRHFYITAQAAQFCGLHYHDSNYHMLRSISDGSSSIHFVQTFTFRT